MTDMISQLVTQVDRSARSREQNTRVDTAALAVNKSRDEKPAVDGVREEMSAKQLAEAVNQLNEHMQQAQHSLRFSVDDISGRTIVRVVDTETDEIIRQIPSEEMLAVMHHVREFGSLSMDQEA